MITDTIHIGAAIESKVQELGLSKAEFARRMGMPPQNVNRLLVRKSIDTDRLVMISNALDYNFFSLYNNIDNMRARAKDSSVDSSAVLAERLKYLEALLAEKERTIKILMKSKNN